MFELADLRSYADDSYLSEKSENVESLTINLSSKATILTNWFKSSGLVVNENKTEFCVFHKNKKVDCQIQVNNVIVKNQPYIKALGVYLDCHLNWEQHVQQVSKSCNRINMGFHHLRKHFNQDELKTLMTSFYYSKMYYAAEIWLGPGLSITAKRLLMSTSSKILKTITGIRCNQVDKVSYFDLHKLLGRATPEMMMSYVQATCLHRISTSGVPNNVFLDLSGHDIEERRHYKTMLSKTNKSRVGLNIFRNRSQQMLNKISGDLTIVSYNQLKIMAKKDFLKYNEQTT